jgi:hypothetical protein
MALMEPALRAGETEPPDEFQEALERLSAARDSLARAEVAFMAYCRDLTAFASGDSGDSATLQTLLDQPAAAHPIPTSRLAEIEREIADALARIADLHAAREQMEASDIGQLHTQATR